MLFCLWLLLVYAKPSLHPSISAEECKMIESEQGDAAIIYEVCIHPHMLPFMTLFASIWVGRRHFVQRSPEKLLEIDEISETAFLQTLSTSYCSPFIRCRIRLYRTYCTCFSVFLSLCRFLTRSQMQTPQSPRLTR